MASAAVADGPIRSASDRAWIPCRPMTDTGFDDNTKHGERYEWWLHRPSGIAIAVKLDDRGTVIGAVRPIEQRDLDEDEKAMGFEWDEDARLRGWVEARRDDFELSAVPSHVRTQKPSIAD